MIDAYCLLRDLLRSLSIARRALFVDCRLLVVVWCVIVECPYVFPLSVGFCALCVVVCLLFDVLLFVLCVV